MADGTGDHLSDPYRRPTPAANTAPGSAAAGNAGPETPAPAAEAAPKTASPETPGSALPAEAEAALASAGPEASDDEDIIAGALDDDEALDGEALHAELDSQGDEMSTADEAALAAAAVQSEQGRAPVIHRAPKKTFNIREVAVPVCGTVGVLLLMVGVLTGAWLAGFDVLGRDRDDPNNKIFAWLFMATSWPIAAAMLAAAVMFWRQLKRAAKVKAAAGTRKA